MKNNNSIGHPLIHRNIYENMKVWVGRCSHQELKMKFTTHLSAAVTIGLDPQNTPSVCRSSTFLTLSNSSLSLRRRLTFIWPRISSKWESRNTWISFKDKETGIYILDYTSNVLRSLHTMDFPHNFSCLGVPISDRYPLQIWIWILPIRKVIDMFELTHVRYIHTSNMHPNSQHHSTRVLT